MELNGFLTALVISLRDLFPSVLLIGIIWTPLIINLLTLVTIVLLIWFLIWYSQQAHFFSQLGDTNILLMGKNSPTLIFLLVLVLILYRGAEIVLFVASQSSDNLISYSLGAMAGLLLGIMMTGGIYYCQQKLNISAFFSTIGLFLSLMVGGMTVIMLKNFNESVGFINEISSNQNYCFFSQDSCLLGIAIAHFQNFLPDNQFPGILLKIIFGYQQEIYLVQLIVYVILVAILIKLYFNNWKSRI